MLNFLKNLLIIFILASIIYHQGVIQLKNNTQEFFPLKQSSSCNNVNAITDIMFGEGENQTLEGKYALANFLVSEAIKNDRTLCEELSYKMPGGALKYSSMYKNLKELKQKRISSYKQIQYEANYYWQNKHYLNYVTMLKFNHYITLTLAKNNPPSWFKYYIVDYKIIGDHVFVNLDFRNKERVKQTGKYLSNYNKLVSNLIL